MNTAVASYAYITSVQHSREVAYQLRPIIVVRQLCENDHIWQSLTIAALWE